MIINVLLLVVLIWFIIHNFAKAKKFTEVSGWHDKFVPIYSIVLFLVTMSWTKQDLMMLAILAPIALFTGWFETRDVRIKKEYSPKKKKDEYKMRRGIPYAIGWVFTFALGIAIHAWMARGAILEMFSKAIWENILEEIDPFILFSTKHVWYIWFLSGVSSITFFSIIRLSIRRMIRQKRAQETI